MVIKKVNLETVCGVTSTLPHHTWPEFAFAGKSNVGKSTLINGLMNRKSYARTSSNPGKTQTINFYNINDQMYFVDLPGYGYATANVKAKQAWGKMIENYLNNSPTLEAVFLLIDSRHAPSDDDAQMYDWILQTGRKPIIIATKADKLKRSQVKGQLDLIRSTLEEKSLIRAGGTADMELIPWGAMEKGENPTGKKEIIELIDNLYEESRKKR
ncbi:MAG: ribosome biogenesis GTP-binding protein YihA/YsxC [Lachnospiraceae bacterium]|nr:ribosome biogenesis GTP-binding protein YihA/YsxC [Lachnospiraceae bacterium]